jgi:cholesterol 7alpha-monooxygenase
MTGDSLDEKLLAERCPALDSLFNETLRSTVTSGLGRVVTAPTTIGDKVLQPGRTVMVRLVGHFKPPYAYADLMIQIPFRELHYNSEAWGPSVTQFNAQRFETEPKLLRNPNFRPWGGGSTMCPGRFLAKRLVYAFIGVLLSRYEVHLDESSASFPKGDSTKPSPGVTPLAEGEDVLLRIVSRGKLS